MKGKEYYYCVDGTLHNFLLLGSKQENGASFYRRVDQFFCTKCLTIECVARIKNNTSPTDKSVPDWFAPGSC